MDVSTCKLIVGGTNRSGTSLVRAMVGSHPEIAIPKIELGLPDRFRRLRESGGLEPIDRALVERLLGSGKAASLGLDPARVVERLSGFEPTERGLFFAVLQAYADAHGRPWFAEKTTYNERWFDVFDAWMGPSLRFAYVVRHPMNVFASTLFYRGERRAVDPIAWAENWTRSVKTALRLRAEEPERFLLLRYEDCVRDGEELAGRLCAFMGVEDATEAMASFESFDGFDNSSFGTAQPATDAPATAVIDRSAVDRSAVVPPRIRAYLRAALAEPAAALGYDLGRPGVIGHVLAQRGLRHLVRVEGMKATTP